MLGELKAKPLARSLENSRALISPARAGARGGSSEGEDEEGHFMSLKIYTVVLELVRRVAPLIKVLRARSSALADQMERAMISIPLNVAEGAYSRGKNRQARFQSAAASARETLACLETAEAMGLHRAAGPRGRRSLSSCHRHAGAAD